MKSNSLQHRRAHFIADALLRFMVLVATLTIAACGGGDEAADPPSATLSTPDGSTTVHAGIGSFCWDDVCGDSTGVVTNPEAATLGRGAEYGIEFDGNPPDYAEVAWIRVEELLPVSEDDDDALVWRELDVDLERAEPGWAAIPDPGIYVYVLRATWENRGEVTYGFYLDRRAN